MAKSLFALRVLLLFAPCSSSTVRSTAPSLASSAVDLVMLSSNWHIDTFILAHSVACCRRRGRMMSMCVEWVKSLVCTLLCTKIAERLGSSVGDEVDPSVKL